MSVPKIQLRSHLVANQNGFQRLHSSLPVCELGHFGESVQPAVQKHVKSDEEKQSAGQSAIQNRVNEHVERDVVGIEVLKDRNAEAGENVVDEQDGADELG